MTLLTEQRVREIAREEWALCWLAVDADGVFRAARLPRMQGTHPPHEPKEIPTMSEHETQLRLECLRLAVGDVSHHIQIVERAEAFYDFITGADRAALADEAKAAVDKLAK